jgi:UDP-2,3-diacylglucosamine hydrolase
MRADTYLFVSDLHLDAGLPAAVAQFLAFLDGPASAAQGLYILGDLFEAWVGDDDPEPCRNQVCEALLAYTRAGHLGYVVRGNRDFLFGAGFEARTGFTLLPDPVRVQIGTLDLFVSHGDVLCIDDHAYQELRSVVRNPAWQARFMALPLQTRRVLADAARSGSKAHTGRVQYTVMDVNPAAVAAAFTATGTRLMVHGHTHRPGIFTHALEGGSGTRIVLGDWYEQGSCLRVSEDGSYELLTLPRSPDADQSAGK